MTSSSNAASATDDVSGPIWSSELANAISPYRDTRPYVGLTPTTPLRAAGWRIDPPVSEPKPREAKPAATATADPPLDPPGTRSGRWGVGHRPDAQLLLSQATGDHS